MIYILGIGGISVFFGLLLLAAPNTILSIERRANKIYMTDPTFMQYRVPFGLGLFCAAIFIIYSLINESTEYLISFCLFLNNLSFGFNSLTPKKYISDVV